MAKLSIDCTIIEKELKEGHYSILVPYLARTFKLQRNENGTPIVFAFSDDAISALDKILSKIINEKLNESHTDIVKELFRSFRNYVVNPEVQKYFSNDENFLSKVKLTVERCVQTVPEALQIILQFLVNLVIGNEYGAQKVYSVFFNQLNSLLKDSLYVHETSALLYNLSLFTDLNFDYEMYICILELYSLESQLEFLHFLVEKITTYDDFWSHYNNFVSKYRLIILCIIREKQFKGEKLSLPKKGLETLTTFFINSGSVIFQTVSSNETNLEPYEVSKLLQVVSSLCSTEEYLPKLQKNKDLLINTGVLLINIHQLGKETKNYFSSIQNLAEIREPNEEISKHPAFGFKADLIRIVGNLCWKNRIMQDLTREAELIPIILDCCNMDARNPFILQWVILAVRNLCENNLENQKIIAGLHQQGTVSSSVLNEMGLTLHSEGDNSIKVVSLDALRNQK